VAGCCLEEDERVDELRSELSCMQGFGFACGGSWEVVAVLLKGWTNREVRGVPALLTYASRHTCCLSESQRVRRPVFGGGLCQ
jgi:hypothetical protein